MYENCLKCGRPLLDEESSERGYGPICWESIEQKMTSYVFTIAISEHDLLRVEDKREKLLQQIERVSNGADFVIVCCINYEAIPHVSFAENYWFQKVDNKAEGKWFGIQKELHYIEGVDPLKEMYSYAPVFINSMEGDSMAVLLADTVWPGKDKNYIWYSRGSEARYHLPGFLLPFLWHGNTQDNFTMEVNGVFEVAEMPDDVYDENFHDDFVDYYNTHITAHHAPLNADGLLRALKEAGDDIGFRLLKMKLALAEKCNVVDWSKTFEADLGNYLEALNDAQVEYKHEEVLSNLDRESGYWPMFWLGNYDLMLEDLGEIAESWHDWFSEMNREARIDES